MDECKGQPIAAAAAEREAGSHMSDADQSATAAAAAAPSAATSVFLSRLLPARAEAAECDICNEPLESSEAAGCAAASSRLPRLLPCGHSLCTGCIQKDIDRNVGLLKCPQCGNFDPPQRLDSALKLPKNFGMIKMIEAQADRDAMAELAALPCQHCDPSQPRQPAKVHCNDCGVDYCKQHDQQIHCVGPLLGHQRISIAAHAAQLAAASAAKKAAALSAVAAASRLAAKVEGQKAVKATEDAKKRQERLPQELDTMEDVVESTAKQLNAAADRLRSDFEWHRQAVSQAIQQLADHAAALAPLRQIAQQVQQEANDCDANLQFAQLQRDSQRLHAQLQQASADADHSFELDAVRALQSALSLSQVTHQSLILSADLTTELAQLFKGQELKAQPELLFRGSRDGFKKDDYVRCCANKGSTMTLVKVISMHQRSECNVAGNNFVFGAYIHCSWPSVTGVVADPTGQSFLFSLVNTSGKAVRYSLHQPDRALELHDRGIFFGSLVIEMGKEVGHPNFGICYEGKAADQGEGSFSNHQMRCSMSYQPDDGQMGVDAFLAGHNFFAAAEIEVFQL